jgi:hypothetical protein
MAGLPIISADARLRSSAVVKGQIWGRYGSGKTWQVKTLTETTALASGVLVLDAEAGLLSIQDVPVDVVPLRSWTDARDLACFFGGANPAFRDDQPYSAAHYQHVVERFGDPKVLQKYGTVFIDSISVVSKLCLNWAKGQPQAVSERTGKTDLRAAYGLLAQELIGWVTHWQHIADLNVWLVGGLEERADDFNRRYWAPLIEGSRSANELPYVVDEVITLAELRDDDGKPYRAFVCGPNPWGYPAKDRSGRLDMIEEPHLGRLMAKIRGPVKPAHERMEFGRPASHDADTPQPSQA